MRVLLVLALLIPLAGCATPDPAPDAGDAETEVLEKSVRLAPRGYRTAVVEVNLNLTEGAEVSWRFNASAPLAWDVHTHAGRDLETLANGTDAEASGSFRAPRAGVYSLFLQNPDPTGPVDATYRLEGAFEAVT